MTAEAPPPVLPASLSLPFQDQVEPVPQDRHPEEPERRVPPQMEPDGEEDVEGGVQVGQGGGRAEDVPVPAVPGLQVDGELDPPAVEKVHDPLQEGGAAGLRVLFYFGSAGLYSRLDHLFAFGTGSAAFAPTPAPTIPPQVS